MAHLAGHEKVGVAVGGDTWTVKLLGQPVSGPVLEEQV
jgi:hypothetical protein